MSDRMRGKVDVCFAKSNVVSVAFSANSEKIFYVLADAMAVKTVHVQRKKSEKLARIGGKWSADRRESVRKVFGLRNVGNWQRRW